MIIQGQRPKLPGQGAPGAPGGPISSGGWNGGAPLQQQPAPSMPNAGGRAMTPFAAGGAAGGPGMGAAGSSAMPKMMGSARDMGGTTSNASPMPSWMDLLLPPQGASGATPAAPAAGPMTPQQQMAKNTAAGNQLKASQQTYSPYGAGGMQVNGLGQVQHNGQSDKLLQENVPMAGHLGTANGPLTAQGIAPGGGGGFGGAGGGGLGGVAGQVQSAQDKANAANQQRYTQLLKMAGMLQDSAMTRETQLRNNELGSVDQSAISAGLGNSTVLPNLEKGVYDQSGVRQQEIGNQGLRTAMGIVERRTDQQPNYAAIAQMAAMPGSTGGGGFLASGGQIPQTQQAQRPLSQTPAPQPGQQQPPAYGDGFTNSGGPSSPNAQKLALQAQLQAASGIAKRKAQAAMEGSADPTLTPVADPSQSNYDPNTYF